MKNTLAVRSAGLFLSLSLALVLLAGCMGWGDMFAPKHTISGDYSLMQGEDGHDVYLLVEGHSVSVAGPLHQIGWNSQYIIFTDANWPDPWNVISVANHRTFKVSEQQRNADSELKSISIQSPSAAWSTKPK